jgi:AcrR family transcriptional regulator
MKMNAVQYNTVVDHHMVGSERETLEMREDILNAAIEMFLKDGFEKTSIIGIAEKLEYSTNTIYLYFKDKTELLYALMEQGFKKLTALFKKMRYDQDPVIRLKMLGHTYIWFALENKAYYDLMFIMKKPMDLVKDESWRTGTNAFNFLSDTVKECIRGSRLNFEDDFSATLIIWGFVHGLVALYARRRLTMFGQEHLQEDFYDAVNNFINAITI